jgi:hypothetical protein
VITGSPAGGVQLNFSNSQIRVLESLR